MSHRSLLLPRALRKAREARRWTQHQLAGRLGVSQSAVSFWERGIEQPSLAHQIQLMAVLPEVLEQLALEEWDILTRLYHLERALNDGKCRCQGCSCSA